MAAQRRTVSGSVMSSAVTRRSQEVKEATRTDVKEGARSQEVKEVTRGQEEEPVWVRLLPAARGLWSLILTFR